MTAIIRVQLRRRRESLGMLQRDLAESLGTVQSHISELEQGQSSPTLPMLERWAYALGLEVRLHERAAARAVLREEESTDAH